MKVVKMLLCLALPGGFLSLAGSSRKLPIISGTFHSASAPENPVIRDFPNTNPSTPSDPRANSNDGGDKRPRRKDDEEFFRLISGRPPVTVGDKFLPSDQNEAPDDPLLPDTDQGSRSDPKKKGGESPKPGVSDRSGQPQPPKKVADGSTEDPRIEGSTLLDPTGKETSIADDKTVLNTDGINPPFGDDKTKLSGDTVTPSLGDGKTELSLDGVNPPFGDEKTKLSGDPSSPSLGDDKTKLSAEGTNPPFGDDKTRLSGDPANPTVNEGRTVLNGDDIGLPGNDGKTKLSTDGINPPFGDDKTKLSGDTVTPSLGDGKTELSLDGINPPFGDEKTQLSRDQANPSLKDDSTQLSGSANPTVTDDKTALSGDNPSPSLGDDKTQLNLDGANHPVGGEKTQLSGDPSDPAVADAKTVLNGDPSGTLSSDAKTKLSSEPPTTSLRDDKTLLNAEPTNPASNDANTKLDTEGIVPFTSDAKGVPQKGRDEGDLAFQGGDQDSLIPPDADPSLKEREKQNAIRGDSTLSPDQSTSLPAKTQIDSSFANPLPDNSGSAELEDRSPKIRDGKNQPGQPADLTSGKNPGQSADPRSQGGAVSSEAVVDKRGSPPGQVASAEAQLEREFRASVPGKTGKLTRRSPHIDYASKVELPGVHFPDFRRPSGDVVISPFAKLNARAGNVHPLAFDFEHSVSEKIKARLADSKTPGQNGREANGASLPDSQTQPADSFQEDLRKDLAGESEVEFHLLSSSDLPSHNPLISGEVPVDIRFISRPKGEHSVSEPLSSRSKLVSQTAVSDGNNGTSVEAIDAVVSEYRVEDSPKKGDDSPIEIRKVSPEATLLSSDGVNVRRLFGGERILI